MQADAPWVPESLAAALVVGARVRVVPNPECQVEFEDTATGAMLRGHWPGCYGASGVIEEICDDPECGHPYSVSLDKLIPHPDGYWYAGGDFAALELEPLDDEGA